MTDGTLSVAELVEGVRAAVAARFDGPVWVHGEISGIKRGRNGHVWFDLVDRDDAGAVTAGIPVVLWSSVRMGVNAQLKRAGSIRMDDGVRIRIAGPLDLWAPAGRLQLQTNWPDRRGPHRDAADGTVRRACSLHGEVALDGEDIELATEEAEPGEELLSLFPGSSRISVA